jgi:hypothetical protein
MAKDLRNDVAHKKTPYKRLFKQGIVAGLGWSIGVTIGFIILSSLTVIIVNKLGGLPLIGEWIASVVEETQIQLQGKSPTFR